MCNNNFIEIIRKDYEEPYHINLIVKASNGYNTGHLEIYDNATRLLDLADALEDFPFRKIKEYQWELGSEAPIDNFAFYFRMNFTVIEPSGKCGIQIRFNNNETGAETSISEFSIKCDVSDINNLGKLFREYSKLEKHNLNWNGHNGTIE